MNSLSKEQVKQICYGCREMYGDRDDHKCIDCNNNIYSKTFYFDNTKETVMNPNWIGN